MADLISDGMTRVTWLTSLASTSAPSAAALEAGTDLESWMTPDGLGIERGESSVDTSGLNSTFSSSRAGRGTVSGELTFKDQGKANPPWTTFDSRPTGYVVVRRHVASTTAYAAGQFVEVYTVKAGDQNLIASAANEVAKFSVPLFFTVDPVDATTAA